VQHLQSSNGISLLMIPNPTNPSNPKIDYVLVQRLKSSWSCGTRDRQPAEPWRQCIQT